MRRATVYLRKKKFLVHASSKTTEGVWILWEPCVLVPEASDDRELGLAIRTALDESRVDVAHPQNWNSLLGPLLVLADVKSWTTFSKSAACVEVEEVADRVCVIPTRNLGSDEGFQADTSIQTVIERSSPEDLGSAVRRSLRR